jgi:hypothetical protein
MALRFLFVAMPGILRVTLATSRPRVAPAVGICRACQLMRADAASTVSLR